MAAWAGTATRNGIERSWAWRLSIIASQAIAGSTPAGSNMNLIFDPLSHTYTLDGRRVPSVTEIVNSALPGWKADEFYLQKGRAMHLACQYLSEKRLDWDSVDPEIEPRVRAWEKFLKDSGAVVLETEKAFAHEKYLFAGTRDCKLQVVLPHARSLDEKIDVTCDMKSTICPQAKVQVAGYCILDPTIQAVIVELRQNGTYRCEWLTQHELARHKMTFLAALTLWGFKQKEGLA